MNTQQCSHYIVEYEEIGRYIASIKQQSPYGFCSFPAVGTTTGNPFVASRLSKQKADDLVEYLTIVKNKYARVVEIETITKLK